MLAERYIFLSDIPWTVIRPEFVYGPGDTHVLPLFKAVISGNFVLINRGESYLHPTCVDDLVQGVELCIRNKKAVREIFNIVGQRYLTVRELAEIIYSTFYDEMSSFHSLNKELLLFPAMIFTAINKILGTDFPLSTSRVRFLTENRAADYKKARDVLGYKPVSLDEGIRETERWYVKNGYL